MSNKRLSLNLVLKKKASVDAFQSAHRSPLECREERTEKASEKAPFLPLEMAETSVSTESYSVPPDTFEKVRGESQPWLCPHCGNPAEIEGVKPSLDGNRLLTFWKCEPCPDVGSDTGAPGAGHAAPSCG